MIRTLITALILIAISVFAGSRSFSQEKPQCYQRDHLAAFLKVEHGLTLHSWGLSESGDMMELFLSDRGHWAVITTQPNRCASVRFPHKERGRLWIPTPANPAFNPPLRMQEGPPT